MADLKSAHESGEGWETDVKPLSGLPYQHSGRGLGKLSLLAWPHVPTPGRSSGLSWEHKRHHREVYGKGRAGTSLGAGAVLQLYLPRVWAVSTHLVSADLLTELLIEPPTASTWLSCFPARFDLHPPEAHGGPSQPVLRLSPCQAGEEDALCSGQSGPGSSHPLPLLALFLLFCAAGWVLPASTWKLLPGLLPLSLH